MSNQDTALVDADAVSELATALSRAADALHARALALSGTAPDDAPASPADQKQAQALYNAEVALRLRAQNLEAQAALCAVSNLATTQEELLALVDQAEQKIRHGERVKDVIALGADLLTLAVSAATGIPADIVAALKSLHGDAAALKSKKVPH